MNEILAIWNGILSSLPVQFGARAIVISVLLLSLAMIFWAIRDAQDRTENPVLPYLAGLLVLALNLLGLMLYRIIRPTRTLAEMYESALAQESLRAEAAHARTCPKCGEAAFEDFANCPYCATALREKCANCRKLMDPRWKVCPYCNTPKAPQVTAPPASPASAAPLEK